MPLDRFCNFVWFRLTDGANEQDKAKLRARLWRPPIGVAADARSPWSPENENAALGALKSQLGMAKPSES